MLTIDMQLAGLSMIVVGVIAETKSSAYLLFIMSSNDFNPVSISMNVIGALIFIIGFFGCCAASKASFYFVVFVRIQTYCVWNPTRGFSL